MSDEWMIEGRDLLPIGRVVMAGDDTWGGRPAFERIACPVCGSTYQHSGEAQRVEGWGGRGDLLVIPMEGECGHRWELCFGFHKGETFGFVRAPLGAGEKRGSGR